MTKQIKIEELIPFIKKGWVAMDKDGTWLYSKTKLKRFNVIDGWGDYEIILSNIFNIAPVEDWTKSLIRIKGEKQDDR